MTWVSLLTGLVQLIVKLTTWARENELIGEGEAKAIAAAHDQAAASLRTAQAAEAAAEAAHAADPTDGAFDQSFKRND